MSKWLRFAMYAVAGSMGVGGALLGYSKPLTMLAAIGAMLAIEGVNYLMRHRKGRNA